MEGQLEFNRLPVDCVSTILSLTSPLDVCRSSLVSTSFQSAADSDVVWESFLPSDYSNIVSRIIAPLKFSSKKELFLRLCNPIFIDDGTKVEFQHNLSQAWLYVHLMLNELCSVNCDAELQLREIIWEEILFVISKRSFHNME